MAKIDCLAFRGWCILVLLLRGATSSFPSLLTDPETRVVAAAVKAAGIQICLIDRAARLTVFQESSKFPEKKRETHGSSVVVDHATANRGGIDSASANGFSKSLPISGCFSSAALRYSRKERFDGACLW